LSGLWNIISAESGIYNPVPNATSAEELDDAENSFAHVKPVDMAA